MAQRHTDVCITMLPFPERSHPAGQVFHLRACRLEMEYYLGLTPESEQSFQGLIGHLSLVFQSCKMVSSMIEDFCNQSQKPRETMDAFADKLHILVRKIVAHKARILWGGKPGPETSIHTHNLRHPYFKVVARGQCLASPDSVSFTQFRG